jgi:O-antigen/teichoic acid export membrane protein
LRSSGLHFGVLKSLVRPALANLTVPLGQAVNVQGMVLVVGSVAGPVSVVAFSTARTLTRMAVQVVVAVSNAVEPELARALGRGDRAMMKTLFLHLVRASFWLALSVAFGLLLFGPQLHAAWTHGKVLMDMTLFGFLVASAAASVLWYGAFSAIKSANSHLLASMMYLLSSVAAIVIGDLALRSTQQLLTAGASLLVIDVLMSAYAIRAAIHLIGVRGSDLALFALNVASPARALIRRTFG